MDDNEQIDDNTDNKIVMISGSDLEGKLAAEFLHNESSRTIHSLLLENEMSANDILKKTGLGLNLINHHITRMQKIGVAEVCRLDKNSKNHDVKIYRAKQYVILPDKESTERAKKSKTFRNNLSRILRLTCIGIAAAITWTVLKPKTGFEFSDNMSNVESGIFLPIAGISVIITAGIIIDIAILRKKKNKSKI